MKAFMLVYGERSSSAPHSRFNHSGGAHIEDEDAEEEANGIEGHQSATNDSPDIVTGHDVDH